MGAAATMRAYSLLVDTIAQAIQEAEKAGLDQAQVVSALEKCLEIANETDTL